MSTYSIHDLEVGMKVRLKTLEQMLAEGTVVKQEDTDELEIIGVEDFVVDEMVEWLGQVVTVGKVGTHYFFLLEELFTWYPCMVESIVEEETKGEDEEPILSLNVGDKVQFKTHEELLDSGWELGVYEEYGHTDSPDCCIVEEMFDYLGGVYTIKEIDYDNCFKLVEDNYGWYWSLPMVKRVVERAEVNTYEDTIGEDENTYHDEDGQPFNPCEDYTNEYEPYCAVVESENKAEEYKPIHWDKEGIQRKFEELELYDKGYRDGFQRALDLMKKKFGVEL